LQIQFMKTAVAVSSTDFDLIELGDTGVEVIHGRNKFCKIGKAGFKFFRGHCLVWLD